MLIPFTKDKPKGGVSADKELQSEIGEGVYVAL